MPRLLVRRKSPDWTSTKRRSHCSAERRAKQCAFACRAVRPFPWIRDMIAQNQRWDVVVAGPGQANPGPRRNRCCP
jgi:hypothetical protein